MVGVSHGWAAGSGVVIAEGKVLTNAHNVRGGEVSINFSDGRSATGRPSGVDMDADVAVIEVDTGKVEPIEWAESAQELGIGTSVFALANPGGKGLRVTFGYVSGTERSFRGPRGRRIAGSVEHTAPLLPGSSGGPIVDSAGRLFAVNTNRLGEGFYLAIPADPALRERVDALARGEAPSRRELGIAVAPPRVARRLRRAVGLPEADGALVREVIEGSPAERGGLRQGDLIVQVDGATISGLDDLYRAIDALEPGKPVQVKVLRGAEETTLAVEA